MLRRTHWSEVIEGLDPERDAAQISRILATHEFPWDTLQALSFALFRTYAVPSIGRLLAETGEFTEHTQKRYDDTGLLLEAILEHGLDHPEGRAGVRRINQMHGRYDIANADLRYVLATFVVMPVRWNAAYGYRPLTEREIAASTHYYRELGRHMNICDLPNDYGGFAGLLDDYEREHFAFDPGARRVADSTLALMTSFFPNNLAPAWLVRRFARALMDEPLLRALRYPLPRPWERRTALALMRFRARVIARMPARRDPRWTRDFGYFRTYPDGHRVEELGTFPSGCPRVREGL